MRSFLFLGMQTGSLARSTSCINLLLKEVQDATECPICTEIFSSPKMLPCFHTFCLKCIDKYGKDKREGDALTCPMCRWEFKVPVGGLSKLRSNFFLERLIPTLESVPAMSHAVDCDVCLIGKKCKEAASSFCTQCQQTMCYQCSNIHGSMTISRNHHISPIGDVSFREAMKKKMREHFCEKHPTKNIKYFCQDCKVSVCGACFKTKHNKHDICDIAEIAEKSKNVFKIYVYDASNRMMTIKKQSRKVNEQTDSFTNSIEHVQTNIIRRGEDIKRMVDKRTNDLLGELNSRKTSIYKNLETIQEDLRRDLMICDSFKQFCTKILAQADHFEIVCVADELATRAAELNVMAIPELQIRPQLKFIPSDLDTTGNQQNIVGKLVGELKTISSNMVVIEKEE